MIRSLLSMYLWQYPRVLTEAFRTQSHDIGAYVKWYGSTSNFIHRAGSAKKWRKADRILLIMLRIAHLCMVAFAGLLLYAGAFKDYAGGMYFGLACFVAMPLVLAFLVPGLYTVSRVLACLSSPKTLGKAFLCTILESQAKRLRVKHAFTIVAVAGSVGKTSTKLAIANVLKHSGKRVRFQDGNYNDRLTVPLVLFNRPLPHLFNVFAWIVIIVKNELTIQSKYSYDVAVLELGTDGPGQIKKFAYLQPELTVITGIAPEHMEFFGTLDAVAHEELSALQFSRITLVNADDTPHTYLKRLHCLTYGTSKNYDYHVTSKSLGLNGQEITLHHATEKLFSQQIHLLGAPGKKIALVAAAVASQLGVALPKIVAAVANLQPTSGRMQVLAGIHGSILLDDTYNATPLAVQSALDVLQSAKAKKRIAVLGSMNELGHASAGSHREIIKYIDTSKLDLLVTIGQDAHDYLASEARKHGIATRSFLNPRAAGEYLLDHVTPETTVLFKGSQNGVFCEEAIKPLLARPNDSKKLVRQSTQWMRRKKLVLSR